MRYPSIKMMLKFQVDVLEKGIMNLTDLLADLHHSHNVALEKPGKDDGDLNGIFQTGNP